MPVKGITDRRRLPRVGKIHLGVRVTKPGTTIEYPQQTEYFVVKEEPSTSLDAVQAFREIYGEKPRELDVMFPVDDDSLFADVNLKMYTGSWGLTCRGDGETAMAKWDPAQDGPRPQRPDEDERPYPRAGTWANKSSQSWVYQTIPCLADRCPMQGEKPQCRTVQNLQFVLPRVRGIGVWQIDTGSWNSIQSVLSCIAMVKAVTGGRVRGIPLKLSLVPKQVTPSQAGSGAAVGVEHGGSVKTTTVQVMDLRLPDMTLEQMVLAASKLPEHALLPPPEPVDEEEPPDDTDAGVYVAAVAEMTGDAVNSNTKPVTSTTVDDQAPDGPAEYTPPPSGLVLTLGDLLNRCRAEFGYDKAAVLKVLKVAKPEEIAVPFQQAYELVRDVAASTQAGR